MSEQHETVVFQSVCQECYMGDGVLVYVKNGKVVKIKGDPDSPVTEGDNLCSKCRNVINGIRNTQASTTKVDHCAQSNSLPSSQKGVNLNTNGISSAIKAAQSVGIYR